MPHGKENIERRHVIRDELVKALETKRAEKNIEKLTTNRGSSKFTGIHVKSILAPALCCPISGLRIDPHPPLKVPFTLTLQRYMYK